MHAMNRPKYLRQSIKINDLARGFFLMIGSKTSMIGRMPVLRGHNEVKLVLNTIHKGNNLIPFIDSTLTAAQSF